MVIRAYKGNLVDTTTESDGSELSDGQCIALLLCEMKQEAILVPL